MISFWIDHWDHSTYKTLMGLQILQTEDGVTFLVKVVPGSSQSVVSGIYGDTLKVNLSAPAEKGRANRELIAVLSEVLGRPKKDFTLRKGQRNQRKEIYVADMTAAQLRQSLADYLK